MTPRPRQSADEDRSLLARAREAPAARAELVARFSPLVWSLCRRLSPTPEDSYQAAWARLLAHLDAYDPERAAPSTWITTVTHRLLVDEHRRRGRMGTVTHLVEAPADDPQVDELVAQRRRTWRLEQALARLPEEHRRVVVLHHLHGVPLAELAEREGVAVGTIKSRLHRGRARLAELLGGPP